MFCVFTITFKSIFTESKIVFHWKYIFQYLKMFPFVSKINAFFSLSLHYQFVLKAHKIFTFCKRNVEFFSLCLMEKFNTLKEKFFLFCPHENNTKYMKLVN